MSDNAYTVQLIIKTAENKNYVSHNTDFFFSSVLQIWQCIFEKRFECDVLVEFTSVLQANFSCQNIEKAVIVGNKCEEQETNSDIKLT